MGLFSTQSLALKWSFLFTNCGIIAFNEYVNVYMKQLGFSPFQIGFTTLMGIQHLCLPLLGYLGDKFRARKLVLIVLTVLLIIITLAPLLPLVVSLPTCFVRTSGSPTNRTGRDLSKEYFQSALNTHSNVSINRSPNPFLHPTSEELDSRFSQKFKVLKHPTSMKEVKRNNYVPWLSTLFLFMAIVKALSTVADRALMMLQNLATITYLKEERASYGSYYMWAHIGGSVSIFAVGLIASNTKLSICGFIGDGYHVTFVWTTVGIMLSSFAIPSFKYEYDKEFDWTEVKTMLSDFHYIIMLIVAFYIGCCTTFQIYWEFWYISELSGSPAIMGVAGLMRRPLVALWFYLSGYLIEKVGDLKIIAASLFLFSVSFLAISFINIPWLVLTIDLIQAAAFAFSYSGVTVHFSKAGSKASSTVILGLLEMVYAIGIDAGSGFMGLLFNAIGTKATLLCYSLATASILVGFLAYIYFGKDLDEYEKLPEDSDEEDSANQTHLSY